MWVRSQDKLRLIKPNYIRINGNVIEAIDYDMLCIKIGEYSSQEKALKVLDMIQEHIESNNSSHNSQWDNTPYSVYNVFQMPLDKEE